MSRIEILQKSGHTIFNTDDLILFWQPVERREAIESMKDYIRRERLFAIKRGIYSLSKKYDLLELAQKLITPSYLSYYTALARWGIIFQNYSTVHCVGPYSKSMTIHKQLFVYHKVNARILYNSSGILLENNYAIASPERAICDALYLSKTVAFDNLRNINTQELQRISKIYGNKRVEQDVLRLINHIKQDHA